MSEVEIRRPERWGVPLAADMSDDDVQHVMQMKFFARMAEANFSKKIPLEGIIRNDARLLRCSDGEIIVRQGDWGNSAFFLLTGAVRIEIERGRNAIPPELLGRAPVQRKTFFQALKQLWNRSRHSEVRDLSNYSTSANSGAAAESKVYLQDFPTVINQYRTTRLEAFEFFGEQSALGRIERTANVFADGDCEILEIRWQGIRDLMSRVDWLRERVDERFRAYGLRAFLRTSPYFEHLDPDDAAEADQDDTKALWQTVVKAAEFHSYGSYDKVDKFTKLVESGTAADLAHESLVAQEGDYPYGVVLVRSGILRVSRRYNNGHQTVSYLTPGQAFGVDEIIEGWRTGNAVNLKYSLRAVGYATVVIIPTAVFESCVLEKLLDAGAEKLRESTQSTAGQLARDEQMDPGLLEFLVERRLVNGSATMVIDLDRCTRCDDCVRACAATHDNNPRFLRHGPVHGNYMIANACMHCADPVCMIQCPTGAIHRNVHVVEVIINDSSCIGCTACANNCPYDAIRMVQIRDTDGNPLFPTHVSRTDKSGQEETLPILPTMKEWEPIVKATKCDLCAEQLTGPACQNACPHDALVRLNLGDYETATNWLNS